MTSTATTSTTASTESTATILNNRRALRICTAGSVDDGKSTFVGRLLHDTKSVLSDQLEAVAASSSKRGFDGLDFSLLVDGLRAERDEFFRLLRHKRLGEEQARKLIREIDLLETQQTG